MASHRQIGAPLTGHTDDVDSVAFSPDGKTLASGSDDGAVRLWDVASHRQIGAPLTGHTDAVSSVAFSPDGKTLASGSGDDSVRLWDVASHRQIGSPLTGHTDAVDSVAFSPDGKTLASGSDDDSVRLWDVASHRQIGSPLTGHTDAVDSVAFSPDGKTLASGSGDDIGAAVGCGQPPSDRPPAHRSHRCRRLGGVQPGRQNPGQRQRRQLRCGYGASLSWTTQHHSFANPSDKPSLATSGKASCRRAPSTARSARKTSRAGLAQRDRA